MIDKYEIITFLNQYFSFFDTEYNVSKIGLFGSFARNEQSDNSDIDIIIEFKEGTENIYERKNALREFLSKHFQREVDLCREKYLKPYVRDYLKNEIIYV
ncbi:nucleotidyltransferase family protein [Candidatus Electronema sp. JM]|uniref:nucleotidyltransferase family protein n=1 Tax=Candidatus Electronema sp. JM TaxID=3401571 RepID=UPI003AA98BF0